MNLKIWKLKHSERFEYLLYSVHFQKTCLKETKTNILEAGAYLLYLFYSNYTFATEF